MGGVQPARHTVSKWEIMGNILGIAIIPGWWFGCHFWHFPRNIGFLIIPIDFHIFQRGGPTTNQILFHGPFNSPFMEQCGWFCLALWNGAPSVHQLKAWSLRRFRPSTPTNQPPLGVSTTAWTHCFKNVSRTHWDVLCRLLGLVTFLSQVQHGDYLLRFQLGIEDFWSLGDLLWTPGSLKLKVLGST